MNFHTLKPFLLKSAASRNINVKKTANEVLDHLIAEQSDEQVVAPELQEQGLDSANKVQNKDQVDALLQPAFPELAKPEPQSQSSFGKVSSAFVKDIAICDLPQNTQQDIFRLINNKNKKAFVVQYGMVVDELLPKVDQHNFNIAEEHLKKDLVAKGKKALGDQFQKKVGDKYILLLNDSIIDGHHFLALAKTLNITCSLRVLDLTSARFQEKRGSVLSTFINKKRPYGQGYNSWKNCFKA